MFGSACGDSSLKLACVLGHEVAYCKMCMYVLNNSLFISRSANRISVYRLQGYRDLRILSLQLNLKITH